MSIKFSKNLSVFTSPHGEIVEEVFGKAVGGTNQHSLAKITIPKGKASLKHYHPIVEESYFILSGKARIVLDNQESIISAGDGVAVTPKTIHQIFNVGEENLIFIAVCSPPWTPECSVFIDE